MRTAILLAAALVLGGCTSGRPTPEIPTAAKPSVQAAASPSSQAPLSDYEKALRYTRCMTEMGVKIKDPVVGEMLPMHMISASGETPVYSEEWIKMHRAAWNTCKPLLPATWPVKEDPAQQALERPFKDCLKQRGIQTYEADSNGMVHYPVDPSYKDTPQYRAAEEACRKYYDDPANSGGS